MIKAKLFVPAGAPSQTRGGDTPAPSPVYSAGNSPPLTKAELLKTNPLEGSGAAADPFGDSSRRALPPPRAEAVGS